MMSQAASFIIVITAAVAAAVTSPSNVAVENHKLPPEALYVSEAPDHLRPYILEHLADTRAVNVSSQIYRFAVTGPSSDNAFTLISTNAPRSDALGVLPHIHQRHYESFFSYKGRVQLWAQKDDGEQQSRVLAPGDYGSVIRNTTHTFQILDPDTELTGVIVPGGFEELFYTLGDNFTTSTSTPYVPGTDLGLAGPDADAISQLESFDVYAQLDFEPRRDLVNDSAPAGSIWHSGSNALGEPGEPYFIANGYGPKSLNSQSGYQVIQPLTTHAQTQDLNFTISTISINKKRSNTTIPEYNLSGASAFQILEGLLSIEIGQYETVVLSSGDVAFIPPGVSFRYWSNVAFTKVLYVGKGDDALDRQLIAAGESWDFVTFPIN
ncbi:quercetin 2,3-dioxygenase [Xylaria sp. FL0064]|nr:quercetin 2,3-dioxygenase [Xylaria sp. FL0064]